MADFANGGVFPGPKIRHFRGLTVFDIYIQREKNSEEEKLSIRIKRDEAAYFCANESINE